MVGSSETETKEHGEAEERSSRESATTVVSGKETEPRPTYVYLLMMPENHNVDVQQNLQEQRKRNIEKARIEARLKLDQMRRTVVFDEYDRASKMMRELGFTYLTGSFLGRQEMEKWIFRSR
ncbi:predicted protein [Arabidopsis lyrata subsp. lyrata]|uniref:Predicted protein n=1 Tax=Arabidopsis lyrata subsp. lyrata TaxID=81972 RepID=D7KDV7_ARALL|nr:predicted protein [Arabidopsis lyrata subsp. lyrata]